MEYGLDDSDMKLMQQIFSQVGNIEKVLLYGSRAKGTNKAFSDIDITLVGDRLTDSNLMDVMSSLSESSLPYFCDVSLYKNITNRALLSHIERRGKVIYRA